MRSSSHALRSRMSTAFADDDPPPAPRRSCATTRIPATDIRSARSSTNATRGTKSFYSTSRLCRTARRPHQHCQGDHPVQFASARTRLRQIQDRLHHPEKIPSQRSDISTSRQLANCNRFSKQIFDEIALLAHPRERGLPPCCRQIDQLGTTSCEQATRGATPPLRQQVPQQRLEPRTRTAALG